MSRPTMKFFWCEYCRGEISHRLHWKDTVQAQAEHLFEEHGIDIHDRYYLTPPAREVAAEVDPL